MDTDIDDFDGQEGVAAAADRPYHSKRPHRKSRMGCKNCKTRKVKCDEGRPTCRACKLRREDCVYTSPPASDASPMSARSASADSSAAPSPSTSSLQLAVREEPLFTPNQTDVIDMKLLWFYTSKGFDSFSVEVGLEPRIDEILKVKIPQHAFSSPFLMNCLLGLSALHYQEFARDIPVERAVTYRAKAFAGYRKAVEEARPDTFAALLATSLLLCALSSQVFRDPGSKPLYIIDWMIVWRGIGLIVGLIQPHALFESGMAMLFSRPPIDLNAAALHIPNNLLFMVSSVKEGDDDFPDVDAYYDTLKYLGSLYQELQSGFSPTFDLRVITWFTFLPKDFVLLAQQKRPRALIIIAHYLAFLKLCEHVWWLRGIASKEIRDIYHCLGEEWHDSLRIPRNALYISNRADLAKLILDNHAWESDRGRDGDKRQPLVLVDDFGQLIAYDGKGIVRIGAAWNNIPKGTGTSFPIRPQNMANLPFLLPPTDPTGSSEVLDPETPPPEGRSPSDFSQSDTLT